MSKNAPTGPCLYLTGHKGDAGLCGRLIIF